MNLATRRKQIVVYVQVFVNDRTYTGSLSSNAKRIVYMCSMRSYARCTSRVVWLGIHAFQPIKMSPSALIDGLREL